MRRSTKRVMGFYAKIKQTARQGLGLGVSQNCREKVDTGAGTFEALFLEVAIDRVIRFS
jgi:hypothetical protein